MRLFSSPSPPFVKKACLIREGIPHGIWIETGTYFGDTTRMLSKRAPKVVSIEPEPRLFDRAVAYFSTFPNVEIIRGTSEEVFPSLLPGLSGDINFWLDGHYSAGITFKGERDTPILAELTCITENRAHFGEICVLIDDVRCFNPAISAYADYPELDEIVNWARENKLAWHIEHDIFVAKSAPRST
jgi:hypothetical protein